MHARVDYCFCLFVRFVLFFMFAFFVFVLFDTCFSFYIDLRMYFDHIVLSSHRLPKKNVIEITVVSFLCRCFVDSGLSSLLMAILPM